MGIGPVGMSIFLCTQFVSLWVDDDWVLDHIPNICPKKKKKPIQGL